MYYSQSYCSIILHVPTKIEYLDTAVVMAVKMILFSKKHHKIETVK